jgi:hypothetical protein
MPQYILKNCDTFYISFDEPNCDANWNRLLSLQPTAKRIHGVRGFDRVYKLCAMTSQTPRLVTVDGDNWVNDGTLDMEIDDTGIEDATFSFTSRNVINNLQYGNGGVKVWNRETLISSNTHENSNSVDFHWDIRYNQNHFIASSTVQNCSPLQAWRAGYREGYKMSLMDGKPLNNFAQEWKSLIGNNISRLSIWTTVGRDCVNGIWAIVGARQALHDVITKTVKHTFINNYADLLQYFRKIQRKDPELQAQQLGKFLNSSGFPIYELDVEMSAWMRMVYINPIRTELPRPSAGNHV